MLQSIGIRFQVRVAVCILAALASARFGLAQSNLVKNSGFETPFLKNQWTYLPGSDSLGTATRARDWTHAGGFSLKLVPKNTNSTSWLPYEFSIIQNLDPAQYRGKPLFYSGWMKAQDGATAYIRVLAGLKDGDIVFREVKQSLATPVYWQDVMDVPDLDLKSLMIMCSVKGTSGAAWFDDVTVDASAAPRAGAGQYDPGPSLRAGIAIDTTNVTRVIPRSLFGMNLEWVFNGHSTWDQYQQRLDPYLLNLASDLGVTLWRFPGGVFANHYHWKNGIGPQASRPVVPTEPNADSSANGFGTDEALLFSAASGAGDMMFTVNSNTGTPEEAADWVRYVNNGDRKVTYWEIGNELYLRVYDANGDPFVWTPEEYSKSFLEFAKAMRAADPNIKLGADVEFHYPFDGCARVGETGCWTDVILRDAASELDFVSVHNGFSPLGLAPLGGPDAGVDVRTIYAAMLAYPKVLTELMDNLGKRIDQLAGENAPRIKIAATEWGPIFDIGQYSRMVDHVKTLGSALFVSGAFNVLLRNPRIETATAFKLLDEVVYGWIGPRQGFYVPKAPYYAFQLYGRHFLPNLVKTDTFSPTYNSRSAVGVPAVKDVPYLDVVASTSDDGSSMSIMVTNRHFDRSIVTSLSLKGFSADGTGTAWTLNGTGVDANTGTDLTAGYVAQTPAIPDRRLDQGGPGEISVTSGNVLAQGSCFEHEFPAHSITVLVLHNAKDGADASGSCSTVSPGSPSDPNDPQSLR